MIPYSSKLLYILRRQTSATVHGPARALELLRPILMNPGTIISLSLALIETLPAIYYGRYLARLDPVPASFSLTLSFLGTWATYLLVMALVGPRTWLRRLVAAGIACWTVILQTVYFGIYREFATLPTVSIVDFVRQTPQYAWALFVARLSIAPLTIGVVVIAVVARLIRWGCEAQPNLGRRASIALGFVALASHCYAEAPFMSFGQQAASLIVKSSHGPGLINVAWTPDRDRASSARAQHPMNIVVFRLEEIAAEATTLERPDLPTMPILKALVDERPKEVFMSRQHFANSTATDVSVLSIYTGLSPAADLEAHRHVPILWDYFAAAGYDTSLFIPFHLEWGDFKRRFNARPGELNLNKLVDAGNAGLPLVYDNSINDTDVIASALDYQRKRHWREPFLQIVSLKMPHAIGEGARVNKLDYGKWGNEPAELRDYYNGIRHNDDLIDHFMGEMPPTTRDKTVFVFLSDHGTRLFPRDDGGAELHRLDNYHQETTKVPFVIFVPREVQRAMPAEKVEALEANLRTRATSNIDVVPTLLGLAGIRPPQTQVAHSELLRGRDLTQRVRETAAIVQLNTGPLRRWDREHFGLVVNNGRYHYLFSTGSELLFDRHSDPAEAKNVIADPSHSEAVANARAIVAEVPELLRIQQKYRHANVGDTPPAAHAATRASLLDTTHAPADIIRIARSSEAVMQKVASYAVRPGNGSVALQTEFVVRAIEGIGRLEWRVRDETGATHIAHVDDLASGALHRCAFRWSPKPGTVPLDVELFALAESDDFSLDVERAAAGATEVVDERPFGWLVLTSDDWGQPKATYSLNRFRQHGCLTDNTEGQCPNGYLAWGPYVKADAGAGVRVRYDVQIGQPGISLWLDLASNAGQDRIAQSRTHEIQQVGSHSFAFHARLGATVESLEGRLNAFAPAGLRTRAIVVDRAELTVVPGGEN